MEADTPSGESFDLLKECGCMDGDGGVSWSPVSTRSEVSTTVTDSLSQQLSRATGEITGKVMFNSGRTSDPSGMLVWTGEVLSPTRAVCLFASGVQNFSCHKTPSDGVLSAGEMCSPGILPVRKNHCWSCASGSPGCAAT